MMKKMMMMMNSLSEEVASARLKRNKKSKKVKKNKNKKKAKTANKANKKKSRKNKMKGRMKKKEAGNTMPWQDARIPIGILIVEISSEEKL